MTKRAELLGCLLLSLLCAQALFFILAIEHSSTSTQQQETRGMIFYLSSIPSVAVLHRTCLLSVASGLSEEGGAAKDKEEDIVSVSRKGGKGRGVNGGANIVHRPPRTSAAPSLIVPMLIVLLLMLANVGFIST